MKKILVLVAALLLAAACAAPPTNREATVPVSSPTPPEVAMTEADAIAKEKAIWDSIKNKDYASFAAMLANDQVEVMPDGVMDKAASVEGVKQFEPSEANFSDWKFLPIDKDAFVITYAVAVKGKFAGKEFPLQSARASSAWVKRAGQWLAIYHQECELKPAAPAPASKVEKVAPSPATTPAAAPATGPDPIANDKIVWDLFKAKNYDAFADLLAPDFVEVGTDGVYDKAGTVKGVQMLDASKSVLSDWKAVNFDADAALVTYVVKDPSEEKTAPRGTRNSSIWVKRDGKWLGLFHHGGTVIAPPKPAASPAASPAAKTP